MLTLVAMLLMFGKDPQGDHQWGVNLRDFKVNLMVSLWDLFEEGHK